MGWIRRRIVGYIVFAIVSSILGAIAIAGGYITGGPTLATLCGALILGVAFLISLAVTSRMKDDDVAKKNAEENARAWQEYYARMYPQFYRQR